VGTRTGFSAPRKRKRDTPSSKSMARELVETVLVCVLFILFLRAFVFQQSEIPSGSMESTILVGDHVLVNRFLYAPTSFDWERRLLPTRAIRRGDVVVFKHPPSPEQDYIKRVIGLPGETVALRDGMLFVDGVPVNEPYLDEEERVGQWYGPVLVPPNEYLLLGDHRSRSQDSREWGTAPRELIKGRAFMILFSTSARPPSDRPPGQVTARSLFRKLFNLAFHSRWERWFTFVR
jgi:signal peptidase I